MNDMKLELQLIDILIKYNKIYNIDLLKSIKEFILKSLAEKEKKDGCSGCQRLKGNTVDLILICPNCIHCPGRKDLYLSKEDSPE